MRSLRGCAIAVAVVAGTVAAAIPAAADDGPSYYPYPPHYPTLWQGLYAGAHIGYGEADSADGVVGGAQIGYNWQNGRIVYGWEADVSAADISDTESGRVCVPVRGCITAHASASIDWMVTGRGRLGYLFQPGLLAYATAGLGIVSGSASASVAGFGLRGGASVDDTETDFVFGAGLEGRLGPQSTLRVEYLGFSDTEVDVIRAGLNFKLGY